MNKKLQKQEAQAIHYIENQVKPIAPKEGEFTTASFWQEIVLNYLKQQALNFVASSLVHLRKQTVSHLVDLADWLLERLEDYLISLYGKASLEEQKIFKQKIQASFPSSRLLARLSS